ncbi:MAG TPA: polysaccharide deacetylase family protein [Candidatus Binatia bacterium]
MSLKIALKVDVCNRRAFEQGVPGLLRILGEFGVQASFFVAFGPDNSGKAVRRIFRRGFLKKMIRTRAPSTYGLKTLLYGTLLPAPMVGEALPQLLRQIEQARHEVGLHGWDHVGWHDGLARMTPNDVRDSLSRASRLFEQSLGSPPVFSGAPGWQATPVSLQAQDQYGFVFASDCRGQKPFYPRVSGTVLKTLQIPTTLPTSDELLGINGMNEEALADHYLRNLRQDSINLLGLHAEMEGLRYTAWLRAFLARSLAAGAQFSLLSEIAQQESFVAPPDEVLRREIPGRAGTVACQKGTA